MLTRFLSKRTNLVRGGLNTIHTKNEGKLSNEWKIDINHLNDLYQEKKYEEALKEISKMESRYVGYSKIIQNYRGKVGIALLEESGELHKLKLSI